jgi:hypothetical protein
MPKSKLVALLYNTWEDADRVFAGLSDADALERYEGGSCFAWTLFHVTVGMDFFINAVLRGRRVHPTLASAYERFGSSGDADDWPGIQAAVKDVREETRSYLDGLTDEELQQTKVPAVRQWPESALQYIVFRQIAHHYFHIGEVATKRTRLGHDMGDYPGTLADAM